MNKTKPVLLLPHVISVWALISAMHRPCAVNKYVLLLFLDHVNWKMNSFAMRPKPISGETLHAFAELTYCAHAFRVQRRREFNAKPRTARVWNCLFLIISKDLTLPRISPDEPTRPFGYIMRARDELKNRDAEPNSTEKLVLSIDSVWSIWWLLRLSIARFYHLSMKLEYKIEEKAWECKRNVR